MRRSRRAPHATTLAALALAALASAEWAPATAHAQLTLTNLVESRLGADAQGQPKRRHQLYDLLDVGYTLPQLRLGARFETFHSSDETDATAPGYDAFTRRFAEWHDERVRVRVGNFYTILGRGLLHRSFEIPGVVLDQIAFPARYKQSRDMDGVLVEGEWGPLAARAFSGRPNYGLYVPSAEDLSPDYARYQGLASGGQVVGTIWRQAKVGLAYTRVSSPATSAEYGSVFTELDPMRLVGISAVQLDLYGEVGRKNADWGRRWGLGVSDGDTAAVYASANLLAGPVTLSAEWKNYRAFVIGPNDPPSLVREHPFTLPNRSTHLLEAQNERGFQLEGSYTVPAWGAVTLNLTRSDGDLSRRFEERYAEVRVAPPGGAWESTVFWERGRDEFVAASISDRSIGGVAGTLRLVGAWSATSDIEWLDATQVGFFGNPIVKPHDRLVSLGLTRAEWGSASWIWVRERPEDIAGFGFTPQIYVSYRLSARLSDRHELEVFAGEFRGGPECTAGTCYVRQPFTGVEMRLSSRF